MLTLKNLRISLLCLLLTATQVYAQTPPPKFNWQNVGPDNYGGRFRALAVAQDGKLFAGSAGGGLWTSDDQGVTLKQVSGFNNPSSANFNTQSLCVSTIAIDPNNNNVIYVGTGDMIFGLDTKYAGLSDVYSLSNIGGITNNKGYIGGVGTAGRGVMVSTDGGATFQIGPATWATGLAYIPAGSPWTSIQRMAVGNNGRAFAATAKGAFYSDDKFNTVQQPAETYAAVIDEVDKLANSIVMDVEIGTGGIVYFATGKYIFISEDNGVSIARVSGKADRVNANDPGANQPTARLELAVAPSNKEVVYLVEVGGSFTVLGTWISKDSGVNWEILGPRETPPAFIPLRGKGLNSLLLAVNPSDPYHIYLGSEQWYEYSPTKGWERGGRMGEMFGFQSAQSYPDDPLYLAPLAHAMVAHPQNPNVFYVATDKEIFVTHDNGNRFYIARNYSTSFCYGASVNGENKVFAGTLNTGLVSRKEPTRDPNEDNIYRSYPRELSRRGKVACSIFNDDYTLAGDGYGGLDRSINDGGNYEAFFQVPVDNALYNKDTINKKNYVTGIANSDVYPYLVTPFVLDEIGLDESKESILVSRSCNPQILQKQYVFYGHRRSVWCVTNPFGGTDSLPKWSPLYVDPTKEASISAITVSGDTTHTVFAGFDDGTIWRIKYAHNPTTIANDSLPLAVFKNITPKKIIDADDTTRRWITSLTVHPTNKNLLLITYGGYDTLNTGEPRVVATFNAMDDEPVYYNQHNLNNLPASIPVYCAFFNTDTASANWLAIGTEQGVYTADFSTLDQTEDGEISTQWSEANDGEMNRVPVTSIAHRKWNVKPDTITPIICNTLYTLIQGSTRDTTGISLDELDKHDIVVRKYTLGGDSIAQIVKRDTSNHLNGNTLADYKLKNIYGVEYYLHREPLDYLYVSTWGRGIFASTIVSGRSEENNRPKTLNFVKNNLQMYPNPTEGLVHVKLNVQANAKILIEILDVNGRTLKSLEAEKAYPGTRVFDIDTSQLPAGVYVAKATVSGSDGIETRTGKLIVR